MRVEYVPFVGAVVACLRLRQHRIALARANDAFEAGGSLRAAADRAIDAKAYELVATWSILITVAAAVALWLVR